MEPTDKAANKVANTSIRIPDPMRKPLNIRMAEQDVPSLNALVIQLLQEWLSGKHPKAGTEDTKSSGLLAPNVSFDTNVLLALEKLPQPLRGELMAAFERIVSLFAQGLGSTKGLNEEIDVRRERDEIDRRAEALGGPAAGTPGTAGKDTDTAREPPAHKGRAPKK